MGLRLSEGIELERYRKIAGQPLDRKARQAGQRRLSGPLGRWVPDAATPAGRRVLNALIGELVG
jgi:hypothetical protein